MKVSLVVPAHNEAGNLTRLTNRVISELSPPEFSHTFEIVLVDDNSTDKTPEIVDQLGQEYSSVTPVHRTENGGFGNAIKAGLKVASGDIIIPFMGDLSDDPADVPKLVCAIESGYDVAYGSRFVNGGSVDGYPPLKLLYNRGFNNLIRLTFGVQARDVTNAFTAYRRQVIEEVNVDTLSSESFDLTAELPLRAHILGFESTEVPVSWRSRDEGVSKLNATKKGPLYLERAAEMFVLGNVVGLRDLFGSVFSGSKATIVGAASFGILILFALFSLSGFDGVFTDIFSANIGWLAVGATAYVGSFAFRTWRYRVLLRSAGDIASRGGVFRSIMTGWFVNFILPARAGDAVRALSLKSTEDVPVSVSGGLIVVERALDMITLGVAMITISLLFVDVPRSDYLAASAFAIAAILVVGLVVLSFGSGHLVERFGDRFPSLAGGIRSLNRMLHRLMRNPYALVLSTFLSAPVWLLEVSTIYFSGRALGLDLTSVATVTTAVGAFVAQAVPLTPAGIGTYEATITAILSLFGVSNQVAMTLGLVDHFVRVAVVYVVGAICTVHIGFRSRAYFRQRSEQVDGRTSKKVLDNN
ncbi:flippase-like domain-containing protein [Haloferax sp. ATB1]|uniref:flippase-like domain-containing protein n=1 Tax=Haloferax sp. ATB1 TaxID=1508454 RepID=UPI0006944912|nr:flippase-like domain-containing protein [Haloferax sp. ATB1]